MYTLLLSFCTGLTLTSLLTFSPLGFGWIAGVLGVLGVLLVNFLISRKVLKKVQPAFMQAQSLAQNQRFSQALEVLESVRSAGKWQLLLTSQIEAQIGIILYTEKKDDLALEHLKKASPRLGDAKLREAAILFKRKDLEGLKKLVEPTLAVNKKQVLPYNAFAFMLEALGQRDEAIQLLTRCIKHNDDNESSKENLLRLQNGKKLNMKPFAMNWYSLLLERPPISMMEQPFAGRRGFRQPKRQKGK